ncbi:MAG: anti-sigma factor [Candidatus Acidiferrales bacterium]
MSGHPTREEDFDLYALGVLEGQDLEAFESHLASCDDCTNKVAEAQGRMALLALAAEPAQPSPGAKETLMRQLSAQAEGREYRRPASEPERASSPGTRWWTVIWAPAAAALALATIFLWISNARLSTQIDDQRGQVAEFQRQNEQATVLIDLVTARDTLFVPLPSSRESHGASARVLYNARLGKIFYSDTLSAPPSDKSYQLWLIPASGNPISAAILSPEPGSGSRIVANVPQGISAKAFAVTLEPAGGRPQPTGPKILVGPVS